LETSIRSYTMTMVELELWLPWRRRGMDRWCELRIGEELEPTSSWWRRRGRREWRVGEGKEKGHGASHVVFARGVDVQGRGRIARAR
jgi:hypothetical protein